VENIIIAIDGHAGCGKSTTAKLVAQALGYGYIDTGAMYRAVTLHLLDRGIDLADYEVVEAELPRIQVRFRCHSGTGLNHTWLNGQDVEDKIRTMRVTAVVSEVSAISAVRRFLVAQQQEMGEQKGIVMDGRDIGTVVFPHAELKIYMTATMEARALRRQEQLRAQGQEVALQAIIDDLSHRDHIDSTRADSPLRRAHDAHVVDTSHQTIGEQVASIVALAKSVCHCQG
jgi:cytidylate kinase